MKNTFLFVEDEWSLNQAVQKHFERQGIECLTALDGLSALQIYQKHKPLPVVVLDYHLPDMTGAELAKQIKRLRPAGESGNNDPETELARGAVFGLVCCNLQITRTFKAHADREC